MSFVIAVMLFLALATVLYLLSSGRLSKQLFAPCSYREEVTGPDIRFSMHPLELIVDQNIRLEGLRIEPHEVPSATVVYFGGRDQDSVGMLHKLALRMPRVRWITYNYRGYGQSTDSPTESKLLRDALTICDNVRAKHGEFALMGYSLGSSIAAYAASKRTSKALFLVAAFDSVPSMARAKYRFVIPFLIRYRLDTAAHVRSVDAPTYLFASLDDNVVPVAHARMLKQNIRKLAGYYELSRTDHNALLLDPRVTNTLIKAMKS